MITAPLFDDRKYFKTKYGPHFTYEEFACKCSTCVEGRGPTKWIISGEFKAFMGQLNALRDELAFPFHINSGYRCPEYNDSLYSGDGTHMNGPHTKGAADIAVSFERAYKLAGLAFESGLGVGIHQRGQVSGRYIHIDNQGPRIWTY